jgi:hypothetical protein
MIPQNVRNVLERVVKRVYVKTSINLHLEEYLVWKVAWSGKICVMAAWVKIMAWMHNCTDSAEPQWSTTFPCISEGRESSVLQMLSCLATYTRLIRTVY